MSDSHNTTDSRAALEAAFDAATDPLDQYTETFDETAVDPFEPFLTDVLASRDLSQRTIAGHKRVWRQWCEHMASERRHPACPSAEHVTAFARHELDEKDNTPRTVAEKLRKLNELYTYWQADPVFPHPQDYNPITLARSRVDLSFAEQKEPPRLTIDELRDVVDTVTHIRDHALIVLQLKLGLRASEVCNLRIDEVSLADPELPNSYPELGTHDHLTEHENAVVIPHDREGNKSRRPRVLPLDAESQQVLTDYLVRRPDIDEQWLFLSKNQHTQLRPKNINRCWKDAFHPDYAETDTHRAVTSHYGRHRFTTYWRVERDASRELVKYMRGDTPGAAEIDERGAIDEYIHTYYEDIEPLYREQMYTLGVRVED